MTAVVPQGLPDPNDPNAAEEFERLEARWPPERPSRRRARRHAKRDKQERGPVTVRAVRRDKPDGERISRALLRAQRELAEAQRETEARREDRKASGEPDQDEATS